MTEPEWVESEWVNYDVVLAIHEAQLAEHGGLPGIRDQSLVESALARPNQIFAYSATTPTRHQLAAAYAFGIGKNHGFKDGNKRLAWVVCAVFLELNRIQVIAGQEDVRLMMLGVADGTRTEEELVAWLELPTVTLPPSAL